MARAFKSQTHKEIARKTEAYCGCCTIQVTEGYWQRYSHHSSRPPSIPAVTSETGVGQDGRRQTSGARRTPCYEEVQRAKAEGQSKPEAQTTKSNSSLATCSFPHCFVLCPYCFVLLTLTTWCGIRPVIRAGILPEPSPDARPGTRAHSRPGVRVGVRDEGRYVIPVRLASIDIPCLIRS